MKPKCLETRLLPNGLKMRRYCYADGRCYRTIEAPLEVWAGINKQGHGNDRMAGWLRARKRETLRTHALGLVAQGWKPLAAAHELGVPERTVQRWVQHA